MDNPSSRPAIEVADVFRFYGAQYKAKQRGHLSLNQLKVMSAIERCRTAQLGGHELHCNKCETDLIAYNSCRNRPCREAIVLSASRQQLSVGSRLAKHNCCQLSITMWCLHYQKKWRSWRFITK